MGKPINLGWSDQGVLKRKFYFLLADMKTTYLIKLVAPKLLFNIIEADLRSTRIKMNKNK